MTEWITHNGGKVPDRFAAEPSLRVEAKYRNGEQFYAEAQDHTWSGVRFYRIVPPAPASPPSPPVRTLRDEFAMAALTGLLANANRRPGVTMGELCDDAYGLADAMLAARVPLPEPPAEIAGSVEPPAEQVTP